MKKIEFQIQTGLLTLEKAFDLLEEIGFGMLLGGGSDMTEKELIKVQEEAFRNLLLKRKLRELLSIITDGVIGKKGIDVTPEIAREIISGFFLNMRENWNFAKLMAT